MRRIQRRLVFRLAESRRQEFMQAGFTSPDNFIGFECGGRFVLDNWFSVISKLPEGATEVMVHPGADTASLEKATRWGYRWEDELAALTDPRLRQAPRLPESAINPLWRSRLRRLREYAQVLGKSRTAWIIFLTGLTLRVGISLWLGNRLLPLADQPVFLDLAEHVATGRGLAVSRESGGNPASCF